MSEAVSFPDSVSQLKAGFAKMTVGLFYAPLVVGYYEFREALEKAQEADEVEAYLNAIREFPHEGVKELIHDRTVQFSKSLLDDETDFFDAHYPNLSPIAKRHQPESEHVQRLRNKLFSFFKLVNNDLSEMRSEWKQIESRLERVGDTRSQLRNCMTGGGIGAAVGSVVPVIGTAIGSALGGYLMNKHMQDGQEEQIMSSVQNYVVRVERLTDKLGQNAKELHMIFDRLAEVLYRDIPRKIYQDLEEEGHNAGLIIGQYYKHCRSELSDIFDSKIDESDPNSPTTREMTAFVYNFIQQCESGTEASGTEELGIEALGIEAIERR